MIPKTLLALLSLAGMAMATVARDTNLPSRFNCMTNVTPEFLNITKGMAMYEAQEKTISKMSVRGSPKPNIYVDTYVHVVAASRSKRDGYVSRRTVNYQMMALNKAFKPYGIRFIHKDTDWTVNEDWAMGNDELGMKIKLRKGNYRTLNIYYHKFLRDLTLGFCWLPVADVVEGSLPYVLDGCSLIYKTMPGQSRGGPFNKGMTTVHEVGHWFGLLHTFEGNTCNGDGDFVDDTPPQSTLTYGCPRSKDSCPNQPGKDSIHNYMDYTDDKCYNQFTRGQRARMQTMWDSFRAHAP